jgi:uncharacterized protein (DUF2141 family)
MLLLRDDESTPPKPVRFQSAKTVPDTDAATAEIPSHAQAGSIDSRDTASTVSEELPIESSVQDVLFRIEGLKAEPSQVHVAAFNSADGFPNAKDSPFTTVVSVEGGRAEFTMSLRTDQKTAIAVFQDLNGDGVLTKSAFGIPVEPYGFSNDARGVFGPPSFSSAAVKVSKETDTLSIQVK